MDSTKIIIDKENILKAILFPAIIAAFLAFLDLVDIYIAGLFVLILAFMYAFSGYQYLNILISKGTPYSLMNAGINGGLTAGLVMVIFEILDYVAVGIQFEDWSFSFGWTLAYILEAIFVGYLATLATHAYKNEKME